MLLFWKLVHKTQISKPLEATRHHISTKLLVFLPLRADLLCTLHYETVNVWGKRFKLPQLTHESFLTLHHSCKIFFWYLPNWTSTDLWCVVLYVTFSTTNQRSVEVQFSRYQKNILQEWSMVKNLSCVSHGSLKRFPHTFTNVSHLLSVRLNLLKSVHSETPCMFPVYISLI